jgi:hypothetical protein
MKKKREAGYRWGSPVRDNKKGALTEVNCVCLQQLRRARLVGPLGPAAPAVTPLPSPRPAGRVPRQGGAASIWKDKAGT